MLGSSPGGGGGVLGILSDQDDPMEPKVKTQKNSLGLPAKPKKIPDQKLGRWRIVGGAIVPGILTFETHKSQAKEIKSSLKQKGIPVTLKPID